MPTFPNRRAVALGFGIPFIAIVLVAPFLIRLPFSLFGIPIVFVWLFAWFPLTSLCLWLCERLR
ncbi:hypothetical protein AmDm5_0456 [Acetobacter malorum]|uniref:DUF3311 domain-containing protein n=1 Tax=Acetobacter malorum TaxID=178901 RepID=A0A087PXB2_9PROT|nr:hypothetical protein AmDm5_0456 [Acetobacter malorum]OAG78450.1 hypothetical protein Amal_00463 [Acetobacter malorum]